MTTPGDSGLTTNFQISRIGQTISHYRILEELGGGGMGVVYKALDVRLNQSVALKFLSPQLTRDLDASARFRQEAQAASALDHSNICTIHEIDETAHRELFLVMAYYDGETLKRRIDRGALPVAAALDVAIQVAQALSRAHASGIVHRDIKPANLMLVTDGPVKVLDFGLAKLVGQSDLTRTGTTLGTVPYMSPEQIGGGSVDARTDVWSLGVVLYEMLAGRRPFKGENDLAVVGSILHDSPVPVGTVRPDVPAALQRIVSRALEKNLDARYRSASELLAHLTACRTALTERASSGVDLMRLLRRPVVAAGAAAVLILAAIPLAFAYRRSARARWVREEAIPQITRFIQADDLSAAFTLATQVEQDAPNDPVLAGLWPQVSAEGSITTTPDGADVFVQSYGAEEDAWEHLGRTPIEHVRLPRGTFRFKVEKSGFDPRILASTNPGVLLHNMSSPPGQPPPPFDLALSAAGTSRGMVAVPGGSFPIALSGFTPEVRVALDAFHIDQYEVTNRDFKRFVDAGGYTRADLWRAVSTPTDGRALSWQALVAQFGDSTGRPGPSTWELGAYPSGQADFPVGGVSWYEAAAYCASEQKTLPTLFHWARAALSPNEAGSPLAPAIIPLSNFTKTGPGRVGVSRGGGPYGTYDMGGNVREWVWNESESGRRWILGGSWDDEAWMLVLPNTLPPLDRSATNGFRCVNVGGTTVLDTLLARVETRKPGAEKPVSTDVFEVFRRQLTYAKSPVELRVESTDTSSPDWIRENISVGGAGNTASRVPGYLFLPRSAGPPFQVVVLFPGLGPFIGRASSDSIALGPLADYVVKSGRAVIYPIWKGSYERWDPFLTLKGEEYLRVFRTRMADWNHDLGTILDGLSARPDIDSGRVGYLGFSFGSSTAFPLLALEDRLKAAVLMAPGYTFRVVPPEADAVNFAPRVAIPVLMLGGRHDYVLPLEVSQKPMFDDLGTPADRKRHVVFDAGHMNFPRSETIREVLAWLDRYLGPVQSKAPSR